MATITGTAFDEILNGTNSADTISGLAGNDFILGNKGNDSIDGGDDDDTINGGTQQDNIVGGLGNDFLIGGDGIDTINGGDGNDYLTGGSGAETLTGGEHNDTLVGGVGNDTLDGGNGDDLFDLTMGSDSAIGGSGTDTVSYVANISAVRVNLASGTGAGGAAGDSYFLIENVIGSTFADSLNGSSGNNLIYGLSGVDTILGDDGADTISGGAGADQLTGGAGSNVFLYSKNSDSGNGIGNRDVISDFVAATDRFDLTGFDTPFTFVGTGVFTASGAQVRYVAGNPTVVQFDTDGDGNTNFEVQLTGNVTLTSSNFISGTNTLPDAHDDYYELQSDSATTISIDPNDMLFNDTDLEDGVPVFNAIVSGPSHGTLTLDTVTGTYTYDPDAFFLGRDTFTYSIKDGKNAIDTATVTINVLSDNNSPPIANNDSVSTNEDVPLVINVSTLLGNDNDAESAVTFVDTVTGTSHGTIINNGNGTLTYTPAANYNGSDSFTYQIKDDHDIATTATVSITVNPVNDAPVANDDTVSGYKNFNTVLTPSLLITPNDTDVDEDTLVFDPAFTAFNADHGTVTYDGGNLVFNPDTDFVGDATFTYRVKDAGGLTDTAQVTVSVAAPTNIEKPIPIDDVFKINEGSKLKINIGTQILLNDSLANPWQVLFFNTNFKPVQTGKGGTLKLDADKTTLTYTPDKNFDGKEIFEYKVTNFDGKSAKGSITIKVKDNDQELIGDKKGNVLDGKDGSDAIYGLGGKDTITGGTDDAIVTIKNGKLSKVTGEGDHLFGGGGKDTFVLMKGNIGLDYLHDFVEGQDRIQTNYAKKDVSGWGTNTLIFKNGSSYEVVIANTDIDGPADHIWHQSDFAW